jgi:CheY-like chemotaxis protein
MLEDLGHEVSEASSAPAAVELLNSDTTFDIVVTDQAMPRMSGLQLAQLINEKWPSTRIILATGYAELPQDVAVPFAKLPKPFTQADLEQALMDAPRSGN